MAETSEDYSERCVRCGRDAYAEEGEPEERGWGVVGREWDNLCPDCTSVMDGLDWVELILEGVLVQGKDGNPYPDLEAVKRALEIVKGYPGPPGYPGPGRFFVQSAIAVAPEEEAAELISGKWDTHGVYSSLKHAEEVERIHQQSVTHLAHVEDEGLVIGAPINSVKVTRVVALCELLDEGPEAVHRAFLQLWSSDHEWIVSTKHQEHSGMEPSA